MPLSITTLTAGASYSCNPITPGTGRSTVRSATPAAYDSSVETDTPLSAYAAPSPREPGLRIIHSFTGRDSVVHTIFPAIAQVLKDLGKMYRSIAASQSIDPLRPVTEEESGEAERALDTIAFLQRQLNVFQIHTGVKFPLSLSQQAFLGRVERDVAKINRVFGLLPFAGLIIVN